MAASIVAIAFVLTSTSDAHTGWSMVAARRAQPMTTSPPAR
jgi:hypothetical protein